MPSRKPATPPTSVWFLYEVDVSNFRQDAKLVSVFSTEQAAEEYRESLREAIPPTHALQIQEVRLRA